MILDVVIIVLFLLFGLIGYTRGFVKSAIEMVKISTSVIVAIILCRPIAALLNSIFGLAKTFASLFNTSTENGKLILIAFVILLIVIIIHLTLHYFNKLAEKAKNNKIVDKADSILGFAFGVLRCCFILCVVSAVVYIVTMLPFTDGIYNWIFKDSTIALWIYNLLTDILFNQLIGSLINF